MSGQPGISIHALLAESDQRGLLGRGKFHHFYPRSPCGERLREEEYDTMNIKFLSTLSLRRATSSSRLRQTSTPNFYPRSPCGERQVMYESGAITKEFLSTLSLRRATRPLRAAPFWERDFYPRSPCGERPSTPFRPARAAPISIHALLAESDLAQRPPERP